jgi:predicted Zn-dependent peptidase
LFFAIDLPGKAFDTYPNAHNFYGDFRDLDAAKIDDVRKFFERYYIPNNAVLAIVGDVNADEVLAKAEKYFGAIPAGPKPPKPELNEPPQAAERRTTQSDKLARVPAVAVGYRMPPHGSRESVVAAVAGELLHNGEASLLYQRLVKEKQVAVSVNGGVNWPLGNPFEFNGPTLMTSFIVAPPNAKEYDIVSVYNAVVSNLATQGPTAAELTRITAKMRSDLYAQLEMPILRASMLSHAVLFDGNADSVSAIPRQIASVTATDVRAFAAKYLVPRNRTIIYRVPQAGAEGEQK